MDSDGDLSQSSRIPKPAQSSRFFDLPPEIRIRIYELALLDDRPIDLHPSNYRHIAPRLEMFLTCQRMHNEAYPVFYGRNTFQLFPTHGRFFYDKYPLLARLPQRYRATITTLSLRLGPGWTSPPRSWSMIERLSLKDMHKLKIIKIMVECDPSDEIFEGFRLADGFYTSFCEVLLTTILFEAPSIREVEFDAYPAVPRYGPLVSGLVTLANDKGRKVSWGPLRGWDKAAEMAKLAQATAALAL